MADIDRTALTLAASPDLETLRAELDRILNEIEDGAIPAERLGPDLVRLGLAVSLPISGPVVTLVSLTAVTRQLADAFPQAWEIAKAQLTSRGRA